MNLNVKKIAEIVRGDLIKSGRNSDVYSVSTDTRTMQPGAAFFALPGDNFDGHDYVEAAAQQGATVIIGMRDGIAGKTGESAYIKVNDTLTALQKLARYQRRHFPGYVIAVTGSVGKTTTKDVMAHILAGRYNTLKTWSNYNNDIGVAKTLLELDEKKEVAVVEMAMRASGEIRRLAKMVRPDYGIITNIEPVHLEALGTIEGIAAAKCELLEHMPEGAKAIINGDQPWLLAEAEKHEVEILTFGYDKKCDCRIVEAVAENQELKISLTWEKELYELVYPLPVEALAHNVAAVFIVAMLMGVPPVVIKKQLSSFVNDPQRLQIIPLVGGGLIINDTYNANPASMQAALQMLSHVAGDRVSVAVLGDMLELGDYSRIGHQLVGNTVEDLGIDRLITVGKKSKEIARSAIVAGMPAEHIVSVKDLDEAEKALAAMADAQSVVLFKASRSLTLEKLLDKWFVTVTKTQS